MTRTARILTAYGDRGDARTADGAAIEVAFRRRTGRPLPGDRVVLDDDDAVAEILPRRNRFGRGGRRGRFQPVAANLDGLIIVIAPEPEPSADLLHRYLAAARIQDVEPIVVINKCDLAVPEQSPFTELAGPDGMDVPVFRTRCEPKPDLGALPSRLSGGVHLLAGQSGVGKSTLANALIPGLDLRTRTLSRTTGKGTHTTTTARLHELPGGGYLVDTPGVWEYGLWKMERRELERGFPEFAPWTDRCRFRNCSHVDEPDCAVRTAAQTGDLPGSRYQAWLRLLEEQLRLGG